ncbi:tetratricopeptide repeat protein [Urechidicola croceus]|uniref:Tetratricopeptide repeat protein n=1 Tax=Urechidicola croceus TaxID=1850246 RepID=A0A1D8PBG9_9FLAO|nr:hypothetical protein [Urechidicola croceus]AOW21851.1 hypothetical protein LPB138_14670 [Urechidicola croceus]
MKVQLIYLVGLLLFFISCKKSVTAKTTIPEINYSCVPQITDAEWYESENFAPLFDGLDVINYPITTPSPLAQKYFNQGLIWAYGFNHAEAARSFYYATKLDPDCAMCYFGYAYVLGPNYNAGMENDNYKRAYEAIQTAKKLSENSTQKEKRFIDAMALRYVKVPPHDRTQLDIEYSNAMKKLYRMYPNDAEIGSLYAESIMNLHKWDLFDKEGVAKPWTPEITTLLEKLIAQNPKHPGAHHFYIHAVEMSNTPERSNASAKVFDDGLVPGAGHLLHMPSHVYIRTGEYHKGTLSNIAAVEADSTYVTKCHAQGAYPLGYYPHNYHFMAATATLEGNSKWAMIGANKVSEHVHPEIMKQPGWGTLQHYYLIPYYVGVKLGKWDSILSMNLKTYDLKYPKAITKYARGMAFLRNGNVNQAKIELAQLQIIAEDETLNEITIWEINTVYPLVQIATRILNAEILAFEEKYEQSIYLLKEAVEIEDSLNYNEPPDWFFSVRHHLGAVQIQAEQYENAIKTYQDDLKRLPKNGWAQHGLKLAYQKLNDAENVAKVEKMIESSWAYADIELSTSVIK